MSMPPRILCKKMQNASTLNNRRITRRLNGTRSRRAAEPEGRPRSHAVRARPRGRVHAHGAVPPPGRGHRREAVARPRGERNRTGPTARDPSGPGTPP